jgi:hypothetical protein
VTSSNFIKRAKFTDIELAMLWRRYDTGQSVESLSKLSFSQFL